MTDSAEAVYRNLGKILFSRQQIKRAVRRIGQRINKDYAGKDIIFVTNLKGSFRFLSDLLSVMRLPVRIDFISMRSYSGTERKGTKVRIEKDLSLDIRGKDVIVVEDIVDTGLTLDYIVRYFRDMKKPSSIRICTLLDKRIKRKVPIQADYIGFEVADKFIVGYGLDYLEYFRELDDIYEYIDKK